MPHKKVKGTRSNHRAASIEMMMEADNTLMLLRTCSLAPRRISWCPCNRGGNGEAPGAARAWPLPRLYNCHRVALSPRALSSSRQPSTIPHPLNTQASHRGAAIYAPYSCHKALTEVLYGVVRQVARMVFLIPLLANVSLRLALAETSSHHGPMSHHLTSTRHKTLFSR
jgi:hypothetical protein